MSKVKLTVQRNLGTKSGTNKAGKPWEYSYIMCKQDGEYAKEFVIVAHGQADIKTAKTLNGGETIETTLQPESREFNGKWYTDIKIWGLEVMKSQAPQAVDDSIDPELGF
jgi:hypothetical protein